MAFDLASLSTTELALIVIVFILFVVALKKALSILKNALYVAVASVIFPILARFLGFPIATDANSIIFFLTLGLGLYAVYVIAHSVYTILGYAEKKAKSTTVVKYVQKKRDKKDSEKEEED